MNCRNLFRIPKTTLRVTAVCMSVFLCMILLGSCRSAENIAPAASEPQSVVPEPENIGTEPSCAPPESVFERAEVRTLSPEEITGFPLEQHPDAAPISVDGKTVLLLSTNDGYAAVWTEEPYRPGEIPTGTLYCFDEIDMTGAALAPHTVLTAYPNALTGRTFSFGWGWSSATASLYCFDESGTLWVMDAMRGYFAEEADADGDGSVDLVLTDFLYRPRIWRLADGQYIAVSEESEPPAP